MLCPCEKRYGMEVMEDFLAFMTSRLLPFCMGLYIVRNEWKGLSIRYLVADWT